MGERTISPQKEKTALLVVSLASPRPKQCIDRFQLNPREHIRGKHKRRFSIPNTGLTLYTHGFFLHIKPAIGPEVDTS